MPHSWWLPISRVPWGGGNYTPPDPPPDSTDPGWIWADGTDHEWAGVGTDAAWAANTGGGGGGSGFGFLLEDGSGVLLLEDGSKLLLE